MLTLDECNSVSLVAEDGAEITVTMVKDQRGGTYISLYIDDGVNISHLHIPRTVFDRFMAEMRTMQ